MTFAAVILAGGASRRMGSPKALLPFHGQTFLTKLISTFEAVCDRVVVVLGYNAEAIRAGVGETSAVFVVNPQPERGQLTSLQTGLHEVTATDFVFFTPVDFPAFRPDTVRAIRNQTPTAVPVVPRYDGRHGHPVLVPTPIVGELLALREDETARAVMHRHAGHTRYIDVDDPGILLDVDDPQAYQAILEASL